MIKSQKVTRNILGSSVQQIKKKLMRNMIVKKMALEILAKCRKRLTRVLEHLISQLKLNQRLKSLNKRLALLKKRIVMAMDLGILVKLNKRPRKRLSPL